MLNYVWGFMIIISVVYSLFAGTAGAVADAVFQGAQSAVDLIISMTGMMCFWNGIMKVAEKGGITHLIAKLFYPVLKRLFPDIKSDSESFRYICMNISANLLGLGNAATPFGLNAMKSMQLENQYKARATDSMILFIVMNTASLQIIPTTLLTLRSNAGSSDPYSVLPCIWISSICALLSGILLVLLWNGKTKEKLKL